MNRCTDEIFFTWNKSEEAIRQLLSSMSPQNFDLHISICMSHNLYYLDVQLGHNNGRLITQMIHHDDTEPYSLPYIYDISQMSYAGLMESALLRAVRCYSNLSDFMREFEQLRFSYRYNGFTEKFICDKTQSFLDKFNVSNLKVYVGEQFFNEQLYNNLRSNVFKYYERHKREKTKLRRIRKQSKTRRALKRKESSVILASVQSFLK